ncbi:MAG: RDD family protein [Pseudomonadota bacterium]|nr:RDD family protein [Nitrosomonas sp.]
MQDTITTYVTPKLWQRILCLIYDFLLLLAIIFIASFIFVPLFSKMDNEYFKPLYQFYLLIIMGLYFIWFWTHGGQTLAMQTWKLRLVDANGGGSITKKQAITRYLLALLVYPFFCIGIIWIFFDRDRQFLHDRIAGTRIIKL